MADFFQNGVITTLTTIRSRSIDEIEQELHGFSKKNKIVLLLPALVTEFDGPAIKRILEELRGVKYLYRVVLSLDRAERAQFEDVRRRLSVLDADVKVVWHDGPGMQAFYRELVDHGFQIGEQGKGRSVWMAMGYILADPEVDTIALHDCDIVNYTRELPAKLIYPVVHPALYCEFSKGFYARVTDKLYGRVTRTLYTPLIRALRKVFGVNRFLEYLDSFRYALSGEFAFISSLARGIRISPTWGLEVSLLSEVYLNTAIPRVCQVEILDTYEHKHHELSREDPSKGLMRMAREIAASLFRLLAQDGIVLSGALFRTLEVAYLQEARVAIEKYNALAAFNGIPFDRDAENAAVDGFQEAIHLAKNEFLNDPVGVPVISAWVRVNAAIPDFQERLRAHVDEENR